MFGNNIKTLDDLKQIYTTDFLPFVPTELPEEYKGFLRQLYKFDSALNRNKKKNLLSLSEKDAKYFENDIKRNRKMTDILEDDLFVKEIVRGMVEWLVSRLVRFSFHMSDDPKDAVYSFETIMVSINSELKRVVQRFKESEDEGTIKTGKEMEKYTDKLEDICHQILKRSF
jgi:hypothetical protein